MASGTDGGRAPEDERIAIVTSFSGDGGVERVTVNLLAGLLERGCRIDLLLSGARGPYLGWIPGDVRVIKLPSDHMRLNPLALARYLRRSAPTALLAVKHRSVVTAVWARALSGASTRLVGCIHTNVLAAIRGKGRLREAAWRLSMRTHYRRTDAMVAVSGGVADALAGMSGLPRERIAVIPNPVVSPRLHELAKAPAPHPWLEADAGCPVVVGVGRLTAQKDFDTLIRAFARLRAARRCRLLILGRGDLLGSLQELARREGVADDVAFPGFVDNPYAYLARARLFVLSSRWEGSPLVLTEALALGVPAVATDCPSGPREILQAGRHGPLVPVGDVGRLAAAMETTLASPPEAQRLRDAVADYTVEASARRYLKILSP
jgi:glycosyltransferase involved in cell wall biosynthesis